MHWSLLASLDDGEKRAVRAAARSRTFVKGETVFQEGDRADAVHLVDTGHFAVMVSTPDGDLATLNVLGPGDFFGELSMLREQVAAPRSATIISLDASQTLVLTQAAFDRLRRAHPQVERLVVSLMADRIRRLSADLLRARYAGVEERLCGSLLDLAEVFRDDRHPSAVIPLTQDQLADIVGCTRPSINQILQELVAQGLVRIGRGEVTILDAEALEHQAGR